MADFPAGQGCRGVNDHDGHGFDIFDAHPEDTSTPAECSLPAESAASYMARLMASQPSNDPEAVALREAEVAARDAEREVERLAWQERNRDRLAAEAKAAAEAHELERQIAADQRAARLAEQEATIAKYADARSALEAKDNDYLAWKIAIGFEAACPDLDEESLSSEHNPDLWEFTDGAVANADRIKKVKAQIIAAIAPLTSHYHGLRTLRADDLGSHLWGGLSVGDGDVEFYVVVRSSDAFLQPEELGRFPPVEVQIQELPGTTLVVSGHAQPINATKLFEAARQSLNSVGQWGGDATPSMFPDTDESRDDWLERVAMPGRLIARSVERWVASGRKPSIYRQFGDFTERADGNRVVEMLVDQHIPRGCITFLVGDSGIGKSSLAHEWIAALAGLERSRPTTILGVPVPGRHFCVLLSAEDGVGMINQRSKAHSNIWDNCSFYAPPDPLLPLEEHLQSLRGLPNLDLLVIDPLRAYLDGNEDASDVAKRFCALVNRFAREMNCAVVVLHHIKKGKMPPRTIAEVYERMRGSTHFRADARMVLCMLKRRDGTVLIGPAKHNFADDDVWLPLMQADTYRVDAETSTLLPLDQALGVASSDDAQGSGPALRDRLLAAVSLCNSDGTMVRRSGKAGLFEIRLPGLAGVARASILAGIAELIALGKLTDGQAGLQTNQSPSGTGGRESDNA